MLVTGLGPTSERVDGSGGGGGGGGQAWTRLALDSFKGSNPVWKATGHNVPVDGRVQTWTRHGSDQHSASEHRQNVHRNVCATIGHFQPTRMGDRFKQVSRSSAVVSGDTYWVYGCLFVFPFVLGSVYASSTSTSSGALRRLLTLCTSGYIW